MTWIEQLEEMARLLQQQAREHEEERKARRTPYHERQEKVVNGKIHWKPIDRVAAWVTAPANWIHKPNAFAREKPNNKERKQTMAKMGIGVTTEQEFQVPENLIPENQRHEPNYFETEHLVKKVVEWIERQQPQGMRELAMCALESRRVMEANLDSLSDGYREFKDKSSEVLKELRQTRMAFNLEMSQILSPLRDVRRFFLDAQHDREIERLREFVELCERIESLKTRGTLDAIADTILKLA